MITTINEYKKYLNENSNNELTYMEILDKHKDYLTPKYNAKEEKIIDKKGIMEFLALTKDDNITYRYVNVLDKEYIRTNRLLYNFYSHNGITRYNDSTSGIFNATPFDPNRLSDEIKVIITFDQYDYETPEETVEKNPIIKDIINFVDNFDTTVSIADERDDFISFSTRENGDVGNESPGKEDIIDVKRLKSALSKQFNGLDMEIEIVDEWVHLNVNL